MMDKLVKVVFISIVFFLISCKESTEKQNKNNFELIIENNLGKKIVLSDSLVVYEPFSHISLDSLDVANSEFKIYSIINTSCGTCIGEVNKWNKMTELFKNHNTSIVLICQSDDNFELFKYLCEQGNIEEFSYPFFLDLNNKFKNNNKFMNTGKSFETVLTNNENEILLMGNPLHSSEIADMYLNEIRKKI